MVVPNRQTISTTLKSSDTLRASMPVIPLTIRARGQGKHDVLYRYQYGEYREFENGVTITFESSKIFQADEGEPMTFMVSTENDIGIGVFSASSMTCLTGIVWIL